MSRRGLVLAASPRKGGNLELPADGTVTGLQRAYKMSKSL